MKNNAKYANSWIGTTILVILAIIMGITLRSILSDIGAKAKGPEILNTNSQLPPSAEPSQGVTENGITVSATNFRIENEQFMADVCFDLPTSDDWTIWDASLSYKDEVIPYFGFYPLEIRLPAEDGKQEITVFDGEDKSFSIQPAAEDVKGSRCDVLYFPLPAVLEKGKFVLSVEAIAASPSEGGECTPSYLDKVNRALAKVNVALIADCIVGESADGYSGLVISSKPEDMSQEQAESVFYSADFFLEINGISGPWIFEGTLE